MPVYIIQNGKGEVREIVRSVSRRNCVPKGWHRVFVPTRGIVMGALDDGHPEKAVPRGYAEIERQGTNWRDIERLGGFSRDKIRQVWNF